MSNKIPSIEITEKFTAPTEENAKVIYTNLLTEGFTTKGPVGIPTLVSSVTEFTNKFGEPSDVNYPYGPLLATKVLENTSNTGVYFIRAGKDENAKEATTSKIDLTGKTYTSADSGATYTTSDLSKKILIADIDSHKGLNFSFKNVGTGYNGYYLTISRKQYELNSAGNLKEVSIANQINNLDNNDYSTYFTLNLYDDSNVLLETIIAQDVNLVDRLLSTSDYYSFEEMDSDTVTSLKNEFITKVDDTDTYSVVSSITITFSKGTNHEVTKETVTDFLNENITNTSSVANTDEFNIDIVCVPDATSADVFSTEQDLCLEREDCVCVLDCSGFPAGTITASSINDIVSNFGSDINSSYSVKYFGGTFTVSSPFSNNWQAGAPASILVVPKMLVNEELYSNGEYYSPAGSVFGSVSAHDYLYSPSKAERQILIEEGINSIYNSTAKGLIVGSQVTADTSTSPFNRLNVRRMTNKIKRSLKVNLETLLFLPNSEYTRKKASTLIDSIFTPYVNNGLIETGYTATVKSGTGTTRNDLNITISYSPIAMIEQINISLVITESNVSITETTE